MAECAFLSLFFPAVVYFIIILLSQPSLVSSSHCPRQLILSVWQSRRTIATTSAAAVFVDAMPLHSDSHEMINVPKSESYFRFIDTVVRGGERHFP